ncbi:MAG: pyridoxamine 5'-phosphate oxidase family protein [Candidatus Jettenia sp.]|uniref:Pyridoxamine 5'-phosphate oxidase n=1 Tax=Candidatus Jettenia caeni TaxID=247490 RepID=I3IH85_9BACT|nr:pyridoxamine 5'-phosphate oxidase family protein [Candidatus Jettenia sp. AMX1]MBC6929196.1 pyridoxamine 5'-phosphate oxidase family protein [Candidatus Jettenia sp.]NUN24588.1 pyridoxamine 5'-phosphate oxidase family protein [Candidatus Jettenia caeni]KAA0250153.1 MAG: pyridoxamine 5'-phosphate oxidase family protein [Candidatus Jettenia sp. AMX1]MCE7880571.1 pyridoxamine 5'-phosphate oxidase family protein [Candidatus Jettenia sp. AMX1]MCQ3927372.1 pyridoxamine 5'-phosphate oxidase family
MRRKDKEITDRIEIEEVLSTASVGRLGTCANGIPYITPMNFTYDKETSKIFLHCANEGRKLDNIRVNQNVCFEVEEVKNVIIKQPTCGSSVAYRSVVLFGSIKILTDIHAKNNALQKLADKYAPQNPKAPFTDAMLSRTNVLEIEIKEMTGKRSPVKPIVPATTDPSKK